MLENYLHIAVRDKAQGFHWYETLELFFVLRGEADLIINNERERLTTHSIQVVNCEDVHGIDNVTDDILYIQMSFDMEAFEQYIPGISTVYFKCSSRENDSTAEEIKGYIAQITRMMLKTKLGTRDMLIDEEQKIIYYGVEILNCLKMQFNYMVYIGRRLEDASESEKEKFDQLCLITDYIYDNCNKKIKIKEVADYIYVSTSYLMKLIKMQGGTTFERLVAATRAEVSLKYLLASSMSITNIAYECGFSAPRYYYKAFESLYGCSPSEYRERNRKHFTKERKTSIVNLRDDTGAKESEILELLKYYDCLDSETNENEVYIRLDLTKCHERNEDVPFRINTVLCTEEDVYKIGFFDRICECRDKLGVQAFAVETTNNKLRQSLQNNAAELGMKYFDGKDKDIVNPNFCKSLKSLYGVCQQRTPLFMIFEMCNRYGGNVSVINDCCIINEKKERKQILFYNQGKDTALSVRLQLVGQNSNTICLIKEKNPQDIPVEIQHIISNPEIKIENDFLDSMFDTVEQFSVCRAGETVIINRSVMPQEFVEFDITQIQTK